MYEKPQYQTPDGYRRSDKNPYKKKCLKKEVEDLKARLKKVNEPTTPQLQHNDTNRSSGLLNCRPQKNKAQISEKAAQLIALAIKSLLRSK